MRLRERILILLFLAFCGYLGMEYVIHCNVVKPKLEQMQQFAARQQIQRCEKGLNGEARKLQQVAEQLGYSEKPQDISRWSDLPKDLSETVDFVGVVGETGQWSAFIVRKDASTVPDANAVLVELKKGKTPVIAAEPSKFSRKGIISSNGTLLFIGATPCVISQAGSSRPATVIVGRLINAELLYSLRSQIFTDFSCTPYTPRSAAMLTRQLGYEANGGQDDIYSRKLGDELLQCYKLLSDIEGKPVLVLQTDVARDILNESQRILYLAGYIRLATVFPAIAILTTVFQVVVVSPVVRLIQNITAIAKGQFVRSQRVLKRRDEIGILAYEFDQMMERLDAVQRKLVEKSYISGMAEMASGILHNARNALSPLVSGMERMGEKITAMDSSELRCAVQEIQQDNMDPKRKADLQRFLVLSLQDQQQFMQQTKENLDVLAKQVYQVEEMLNGQKFFNSAARPLESIGLKQLIEESAALIPARLRSEVHVIIDREIEQFRPVRVHRVVFLQVLENLLVNAAESLVKAKPLYPKIRISAKVEPIDNIEMLHLRIEDNGTGIEPEIMKKLFERGISSKPEGMTGIGLHWCANTIAAMKGRIWAESEGKNRGAYFHIVIPVWQDKETLTINEEKGADYESGHEA
ncbi:MAG: HAMP domain-containing protein [Planctomycetes bacterium]|nr:HAMP domain-containing protein [Planctomycetota bacterium]